VFVLTTCPCHVCSGGALVQWADLFVFGGEYPLSRSSQAFKWLGIY
jgi:hypothetical protein